MTSDLLQSGLFLVLLVVFAYFLFTTAFKTRDRAWVNKVRFKMETTLKTYKDKKVLVMELDKILEYVLQEKFQSKLSIGKLLKENKTSFSKKDLDAIWFAHKLRNKLAHDFDFSPEQEDLKKAVGIFKKAIGGII